MKKIVLLIIALVSINSFAQTEKGKIYIGASSNLNFNAISTKNVSSNFTSETKNSRFAVSPQIGYFLADNFLTGLEANLSFSTFKNNNSKENQNTYIISPFIKYYFTKKNIKPFVKAKYGFGKLNTSNSFNPVNSIIPKTDIQTYSFGGGLAYFINNFIAIELNLEYYSMEFNTSLSVNQNNIVTSSKQTQTDTGFNSNIGFSIFL